CKPRETREGAAKVVPSVVLVAVLSLVFAIGTGQHFTTFGLYVASALFVSVVICLFRGSYELLTRVVLRAAGVRRRLILVGDEADRRDLRESLGATAAGTYFAFVAECQPGPEVDEALAQCVLDEVVVADGGYDDQTLLEIVDASHRRGVKVRVAPRTSELLIERGEYVPGQGLPLFELR